MLGLAIVPVCLQGSEEHVRAGYRIRVFERLKRSMLALAQYRIRVFERLKRSVLGLAQYRICVFARL